MARSRRFGTDREGYADVAQPGESVVASAGQVTVPAEWSGVYDVVPTGADVYVSQGTDKGTSGHLVVDGSEKSFALFQRDTPLFVSAPCIISFWY